jgi:integrase
MRAKSGALPPVGATSARSRLGRPTMPGEWKRASVGPALAEIRQASERIQKDTLKWLITRYKEGPSWVGLAQSTRNCRDGFYRSACQTSGDFPFAEIDRGHIERGIMKRLDKGQPSAANNFLSAMSALFDWALKGDYVDKNPCDGIDRKSLRTDSDGHHTWTQSQLEKFRDHHPIGSKARLALELLYHTGLRRGDAMRLGPAHIDGDLIEFKTSKNGEIIYAEMVPELREAIEAAETGTETFLISDKYSKPFADPQTFGDWFARKIEDAELPAECVTHGVRKASATAAADDGADTLELMSKYGWRTMAMAKKYTEQRDRKKAALRASKRLSKSGATIVPFPAEFARDKKPPQKPRTANTSGNKRAKN